MPALHHAISLDIPDLADPELPLASQKAPSHFRRSISIFSRKGAETPEPSPGFLSQAGMRQPKLLSQRQKAWVARRKSCSDSPISPRRSDSQALRTPKTPRGTILHSVPPAKTIYMTALEEEMASSPNDEIISAISEHAPTLNALTGSVSTLSLNKVSWKSRSTTSLTQRTKSTRRRETNTRIGEWRDGITHWDDGVFHDCELQRPSTAHTGLTPVQPVRMSSKRGPQLLATRPTLTVEIPGAPLPRSGECAIPTILQPKPRRQFPSVHPRRADFEEQDESRDHSVSPLDRGTDLELPIMKPPVRPRMSHPMRKAASAESHASSESSNKSQSDATAPSSRRSSATSYEAVETAPVPNMNKKLPPLPKLEPICLPYLPYRPLASMRIPATPILYDSSKVLRPSRSFVELDACDRSFLNSSPYLTVPTSSPTLSQAEQELHDHLSAMPQNSKIRGVNSGDRTDSVLGCSGDLYDDGCRSPSGSEDDARSHRTPSPAPSRAPTIPRRSRKREWRVAKAALQPRPVPLRRRSESQLKPHVATQQAAGLRKTASVLQPDRSSSQSLFPTLTLPNKLSTRSSVSHIVFAQASQEQSYTERAAKVVEEACSSTSAESVLLRILSALNSIRDLVNTATISKGMYRIYNSNKMQLVRQVTFNSSPAAWEFREWNPQAHDDDPKAAGKAPQRPEQSPASYLRCHSRDMLVIERLKRLILDKCQTFIRRETAFALSTPTHPHATRFNDAFWRIWCFCKIFGSNTGREEDITGQLDWLKGGLLANNQGCVATVNTNLDFEMSSVLLNAPDHFAKANEGGLTASQLFDMTELWNCMTVLLQGYLGRTHQAREHGIFAGIDVEEGDIEREEQILEEWTYRLLTLGPKVILDMAELATDSSPAGFTLAQQNGWTTWTLPMYNDSCSNFLKEPVAKTYEGQVAAAKLMLQDPIEQEKKERSRQRVASLAAEIRVRRQSSAYKRSPYIVSERAMSVMSRKGSISSSSRSSSRRTSAATSSTPLSPISLWSCPRTMTISPIIEERPEPFSYSAFQSIDDDNAVDSGERAVQRIVSMGFLPQQAREALRLTDSGQGLKLDRAVSWLLAQG